ncbi:MAG: hypothetical protein SXA11_26135, partial [Cyanobacteriota bacterium]|nr:hypothetical protein [Cyanobacteriota bacterium]
FVVIALAIYIDESLKRLLQASLRWGEGDRRDACPTVEEDFCRIEINRVSLRTVANPYWTSQSKYD